MKNFRKFKIKYIIPEEYFKTGLNEGFTLE